MREEIKISDYDYPLPEERIAKFPLGRREDSRLLLFRNGQIGEDLFSGIGRHLAPGSVLVFNDTRVVRARLAMHRASGARIEVFCLEPLEPADYERAFSARGRCSWLCMAGNLKKWKDPVSIDFPHDGRQCRLTAERGAPMEGNGLAVHFSWNAEVTFGELLELLGRTPIPPYLCRDSEAVDEVRYQTVYARVEGSVAAPTAGLHFSDDLLDGLREAGIETAGVTLHVGAGTFLPVKSETAAEHVMHTEHFEAGLPLLRTLLEKQGDITAVGTTTVRSLESLAALGYRINRGGSPETDKTVGQWEVYGIPASFGASEALGHLIKFMENEGLDTIHASTRIMIMPGFTFRFTDRLVTNFHQPQSTLLLLVSAFTGRRWRTVYDYALAEGFRFLSYGDSSLLWRHDDK